MAMVFTLALLLSYLSWLHSLCQAGAPLVPYLPPLRISRVSPVHLPCISRVSPVHLPQEIPLHTVMRITYDGWNPPREVRMLRITQTLTLTLTR